MSRVSRGAFIHHIYLSRMSMINVGPSNGKEFIIKV